MRIAVSADNKNGLDSVVSPHFGRCPHFILVDLQDQDVIGVREVDNPFYGQHQPGQVPGFINSLGANVMLTGGMGGRAIMFFQQYRHRGCDRGLWHGAPVGGALPGRPAPGRSAMQGEPRQHGHLPSEGEYEQDDAGRLREEAEMLQQQLEEVGRRLNQLSQ